MRKAVIAFTRKLDGLGRRLVATATTSAATELMGSAGFTSYGTVLRYFDKNNADDTRAATTALASRRPAPNGDLKVESAY